MSHPLISPPHSTEAEQTVIGALIADADAIYKIDGRLRSDDFYDPVHALIYKAILELTQEGSPIDLMILSNKLQDAGQVNAAGGSAYLSELTTTVPTSAHIEKYADIVIGYSRRRQLAKLGKKMAGIAEAEEKTADELIEMAEQEFLKLSQHTASQHPVALKDMCFDRHARYTMLHDADDPVEHYGIRTGFPALDDKLTAMAPGQMIVVAGRTSMGKTAFALNIARNVGMTQGKTVGIFSLEMENAEIFDRMFGDVSGIGPWRLNKGRFTEEELGKIGPAMDRIGASRIYVDDDPNHTLTNIRSKARRLHMEHGLDLLIIDYLQLIEVTQRSIRDNATQMMTHISKSVKRLARELHCPILALCQLNRYVEHRPDKQPQLSDLRESGAIEQDADRVLMLYREGYYDPDVENPNLTDVFIRKNRNGPTGRIELDFDPEQMRFTSRVTKQSKSARAVSQGLPAL
ncbi:MAG: replicative DNA helicase [Planctomycetes bacterium]|nr:replicative DNA helicase [Planctomycetota bacterium]